MKKKIAIDMSLNILATAIPTVFLQLILLPAISRYMDGEKYGLLVTILALFNMIPSTFGSVLNNIRLIDSNNTTSKIEDNYNIILIILAFLTLVFMTIFTLLYDQAISLYSLLLTLITSVLLLLREYYIVAFRIKLNYYNIVISNLVMVLGYLIGFLLFRISGKWQYIYILGYFISLVFIFSKSDLFREPYRVGPSFKKISLQTTMLVVATFLGRITTYADKLIIFPFLGGTVVSVYYAATLFGKVVSLAINPMSSVLLSYLSRYSRKDDKTFFVTLLSSTIVCVLGYFICIIICRPILSILYPQFYEQAMRYIYVTTATMVITTLISVVNPFVLKFYDMYWQILINFVYVIVYVGLSMLLLNKYGLAGFCFGALLSSIIKLFCLILIYYRSSEKVLG